MGDRSQCQPRLALKQRGTVPGPGRLWSTAAFRKLHRPIVSTTSSSFNRRCEQPPPCRTRSSDGPTQSSDDPDRIRPSPALSDGLGDRKRRPGRGDHRRPTGERLTTLGSCRLACSVCVARLGSEWWEPVGPNGGWQSDADRYQAGSERLSIDELMALWRRADDLGFESIWVYDHLTGEQCHEASALLGALAAATSRARIGCLVIVPGFRAVASFAAQLATIDAMSGGRLEVGVGAGDGFAKRDYDALGLPFPDRTARMRALESIVTELTALTGPASPLAAKSIQQPIPLVVGGRSDEVRSLAAERGLAWNESVVDIEQFAARAVTMSDPQAQVFVRELDSVAKTVDAFRNAGATRLVLVLSPPISVKDLDWLAGQVDL